MEKLQMVLNFDNTLCLDIYSEKIYDADFPQAMSNYCDYVEQSTKKTLRMHPFKIGQCVCCGHSIVSNRDKYTQFKCQNCGKITPFNWTDTIEAQSTLKHFCEIRKITTAPLEGYYADVLVILANGFSQVSLLEQIFKLYGFESIKKEGRGYDFLVNTAILNGFIDAEHNLAAYARTKLTDQDESYDGLIPRVEELDRCIRKMFANTYTVSNLVHAHKNTTEDMSKEELQRTIQKLISEGKMEEALELSRKSK